MGNTTSAILGVVGGLVVGGGIGTGLFLRERSKRLRRFTASSWHLPPEDPGGKVTYKVDGERVLLRTFEAKEGETSKQLQERIIKWIQDG